jgi:hypothetical protein
VALFKDAALVRQSMEARFDPVYSIGELAPYSGIYRCDDCHQECVSTEGHRLPPDGVSHECESRKWRLLVAAEHKSEDYLTEAFASARRPR